MVMAIVRLAPSSKPCKRKLQVWPSRPEVPWYSCSWCTHVLFVAPENRSKKRSTGKWPKQNFFSWRSHSSSCAWQEVYSMFCTPLWDGVSMEQPDFASAEVFFTTMSQTCWVHCQAEEWLLCLFQLVLFWTFYFWEFQGKLAPAGSLPWLWQ